MKPGLIPDAGTVAKWFVEGDEPGKMHGLGRRCLPLFLH